MRALRALRGLDVSEGLQECRAVELLRQLRGVGAAQRRAAAGASLGVVSMEERVALAGGSFQIHSAGGQGTVVVASFPLGGG
jgi:glucose-6-phosphate-specific signal transduction histidine kinase